MKKGYLYPLRLISETHHKHSESETQLKLVSNYFKCIQRTFGSYMGFVIEINCTSTNNVGEIARQDVVNGVSEKFV